jgi:hypothetical protein
MTGSIDFEYDRGHDVVIARPRWVLETATAVMRWYKLQADYLRGRFGSPKDLITLNDAFDMAPRIATLWGAYGARLHETLVRFSVHVRSNPRVLLTTNTSGVRYGVGNVEAADLPGALRALDTLRAAADSVPTQPSMPQRRRTLPQFELHADGAHEVTDGASEVSTVSREVMDAAGHVRRTEYVFCPNDLRSRPRGACATCNLGSPAGDGSRILCRARTEPLANPSRLAAATPLGMAMDGVRCASAEAPPGDVARSLVDGPVVVVDERGAPLGLAAVDRRLTPMPTPEARTSVVPVATLEESDVLEHALDLMAKSRARRLCVVDREGFAAGMLSDVLAMRWLARQRRLALGMEEHSATTPGRWHR